MTQLPLIQRKELLDAILDPTEAITKVQWMYGSGTDYFNLVKEHGLEGIVLKKADSKYQINKRSHDWLKVIHYRYADAFVTGIRKEEFGLLLALEEEGKVRSAGVMEFMNPDARKTFYDSYRDYSRMRQQVHLP